VAQSYAFGAGAFAVPENSTAIVVADLNGDGRLDMVVASGYDTQDPTVSVLLGRPDGSFAPHVDYSLGLPYGDVAVAVAVGDFNGDGKLDLVTLVSTQPSFQILLGNGDGTFQPAVSFQLSDPLGVSGVAVGDFNKDGKLDIAVAGQQFAGPVVSVLLGNGDGTFGKEVDYATAGSVSVITGDFNGDGNIDSGSRWWICRHFSSAGDGRWHLWIVSRDVYTGQWSEFNRCRGSEPRRET